MHTPTDEKQIVVDEARRMSGLVVLDNPLLSYWADTDNVYFDQADAITRWSYGIPTDEALETLVSYSPLVEMGAGTGYWAALLAARGADIKAFDYKPPMTSEKDSNGHRIEPNAYCSGLWYDVRYGTPSELVNYADRTLFLCWPPIGKMASECLHFYFRGKRVAYVGEFDSVSGGCTANQHFCLRLEREFSLVKVVPLPNWPDRHDNLMIWERRARTR